MNIDNIHFDIENENLDDIEYYEIVSINEIIKNNPVFIAFSNDELYNELYDFFKDKNKVNNFLNLFYNIINNINKNNFNYNYIIISDANRKNLEDNDLFDEFIDNIKKLNKTDYKLSQINKNKLWFPIDFNINDNDIKYKPEFNLIISMINNNNDLYYIYKNDDINIPVYGVYYNVPTTTNNDYLSSKILSHFDKNEKINEILAKNYKSFNDIIKNVKPLIPLDKINDLDDLDYNNINILLNKYDLNLDFININDFNDLKELLDKKINNIKHLNVIYNKNLKIKKPNLIYNKFTFFDLLFKINYLIDITINFNNNYEVLISKLNDEYTHISGDISYDNIYDILITINNSSDDTAEQIIENIKNIKKNLIIKQNIKTINEYKELNKENINLLLNKYISYFNNIKNNYKDIYKIDFSFDKEIDNIKIGNNIKKYEGFINNNLQIFEDLNNDNDEYENFIDDDFNINIEFDKYYNTSLYNKEEGFIEILKIILPFLKTIENISNIYINYDLLINELFNKFRSISSLFNIIKKNLIDNNIKQSDEYIKNICLILPKNILDINDTNLETKIIQKSFNEFINNIINFLYTSISFWSIDIQKEVLNNNFFLNENKIFFPCFNSWNILGFPFDTNNKEGIFYYIICIITDYLKKYNHDYIFLSKDFSTNIKKYIDDEYNISLSNLRKINPSDNLKKNNKKEIAKVYQKNLVEKIKSIKEKGKYDDTVLIDYTNALVFMPSLNFKQIHKYLLGCCLQKININFKPDSDLDNRKDLIIAKNLFNKVRELNKPIYSKYHPSKIINNDLSFNFKKNNLIINENINEFNNIKDWLLNMKGTSILLPDDIIDEFIKEPKNAIKYINKNLSLFQNTVNDKKTIINLNDIINPTNIILGINNILYSYLFRNYNNIYIQLNEILINIIDDINILISISTIDNISDINYIKSYILSKIICLPSNPDISFNNVLKPTVDISHNDVDNISKSIFKYIINYIKNSKFFNLDEQIKFVNAIREENKNKTLSILNKKTDEERNIIGELKKLGIKNIIDDNDDNNDIPINNDIIENDDDENDEEEIEDFEKDDDNY